jgi:hypothetical protein
MNIDPKEDLDMRVFLIALMACLVTLSFVGHGHAADAAAAPPLVSTGAEAAHQVAAEEGRVDWHLDTAIFTDISPIDTPEVAIKLPEDQQEEG